MPIKKLYNRALENIALPVGDFIEGGSFVNWLRRYRREQWLSSEDFERLQNERLAAILEFARRRVPFYENQPPLSGKPSIDIQRFPIMRKTVINENIDSLTVVPKENLIASSGSGSSGVQGTVYLDKSAQASQRAMQMLWFEWSGYRAGESILQTGMTLERGFVKNAKDWLLRTLYIPAFTLDAKSLEIVLRRLQKQPRQYLFGYASSLYVLAKTALEMNVKTIRFKYAVSWGDKLFPHFRQKIREAFGCETLDTYGSTEGAMIGAECTAGTFHLCGNQTFIEVVNDEGEPVAKGEMGKVLATRLDNYAMPLIRYYLGDLIELDSSEQKICLCGRSLPKLQRIIGRDTDIIRTRSGKYLIVHFFTAIFEHIPQIKQFQVVQKSLDEIEIHFIPGRDFNAEIFEIIENKINENLREKFPVRWMKTDFIAPTGSGKPQIIQSFLKQKLSTQVMENTLKHYCRNEINW